MGLFEEIKEILLKNSQEIHALHVKVTELSEKILTENNEAYLGAAEAAKYLDYSYSHFLRFCDEIGPIQRDRKMTFKKSDLDKWAAKNKKHHIN